MKIMIIRGMSARLACAVFAGIVGLSMLPGCDSAPPTGSVDMGGKEGRDNIKPGEAPKPAGDKAAVPVPKNNQFKSIK